jgi:hypothetical protein
MKTLLFSIIVLFGLNSYAGGYRFPNQSFSYAQLHLFNTQYENGRPDLHIYKDGIYAPSKVGNGVLLDKKFISKMNSIFNHGIDEIWMGLSKCTIPRHGIIFYNNDNEPIASISICFECMQVNFWSSRDLNHHPDYDNMDLDKAERQIKDLKKLIKTTGLKVFVNNKEYSTYVDTDKTFKNEGILEIKDINLDSLFGRKIVMSEVKNWIRSSVGLKRDTIEKITQSNSYFFYEYKSSNKNDFTKFLVSGIEEDSYLIQTEIFSPYIILPNSIQIGMSTNDVLRSYSIKDEPTYPKELIVIGENSKIVYTFKNQTLIKVMLYVSLD